MSLPAAVCRWSVQEKEAYLFKCATVNGTKLLLSEQVNYFISSIIFVLDITALECLRISRLEARKMFEWRVLSVCVLVACIAGSGRTHGPA